jgi:hypothetical protein
MLLQRIAQCRRCNRAVGCRRKPGHLGAFVFGQPFDGVEYRVMLDRGGDDAPTAGFGVTARPVDALYGQIVALGATRGEDHLGRARAEQLGQRLARFLHAAPGNASGAVQRRRVADRREHSRHRLDGSGMHRGGGGVIQVDRR